MVDLKDPKVQKWFLGILAAIVAVYIWHSKVYQPNEQKIEMGYMRYEALQTQLKNVEMKFQSLDALKQEYRDLTDRYSLVAKLLPEDDQLAPLLTKIHAAALETSTRISDIQPMPPRSEGFYDRNDFKMTLHATYHDLGDFLARIGNLPFIVNVDDVQMAAADEFTDPRSAVEGYSMTADLTISTYKVKESERLLLADF